MNRSDRLLLETQVRNLDEMQRNIIHMRSVLMRRISRIREPTAASRAASRQIPVAAPSATVRTRQLNEARMNLINDLQLEEVVPIVPNVPIVPRVVTVTHIPAIPIIIPEFCNKITTKTKALNKKEKDKLNDDVCGICLEHHKKLDTVKCNCNHEFGNECLKKWKLNCNNNSKKLSCPTCRMITTNILSFKERATRTVKPKNTQIVENPNIHVIELLD